jgi:hypothetical protein
MVKRNHFELGHDVASDRWYITGPAYAVEGAARLRAAGAVAVAVPGPTLKLQPETRWMFVPGIDGRDAARLCAELNAALRDTVWRKPDSAAGRKRSAAAAAAAGK